MRINENDYKNNYSLTQSREIYNKLENIPQPNIYENKTKNPFYFNSNKLPPPLIVPISKSLSNPYNVAPKDPNFKPIK